jgi:hypothetical protein
MLTIYLLFHFGTRFNGTRIACVNPLADTGRAGRLPAAEKLPDHGANLSR